MVKITRTSVVVYRRESTKGEESRRENSRVSFGGDNLVDRSFARWPPRTIDEHRRFARDRWRTEIHFTANTIQ